MIRKETIIIGIDPDVIKSGIAVYDTEVKDLETKLLNVADLIKELDSYLVPIFVILEAGWLIKKSNWHGAENKFTAARIGKNVGQNHASGMIIEQFLIKMNIPYELVKPKGKIDSVRFEKLTGIKRSNQDVRDAVMLISHFWLNKLCNVKLKNNIKIKVI